jgi:ribosome biogenesis GTPase
VFHLHDLGWNSFFQQHIKPNERLVPARVVEEQRAAFRVACAGGELLAEVSGHLRHSAIDRASLPAVGDWVLIDARPAEQRATIHEVLPRRTKFSRKVAGNQTAEQVIAANIDVVFLMTSLNADLNPRRIERYLATVWESGAQPVVLLSKSDLCDRIPEAIETITEVALGVEIHSLSAITGSGLDEIRRYFVPGQTIALLGSSGVGKSTLINRLLDREAQTVRDIREDDERGRHTTTARRLFVLSGGGMLIDTPGMRELQLWDVEDGLSQAFDDIERLAGNCRFRDCQHESEPDCAVRMALDQQQLDLQRFESYLKLRRELNYLDRKQDVLARVEQNRKWKRVHKAAKQMYRQREKP